MAIKRSTGLVDKLNGIKTNMLSNGEFSSTTTSWSTTGSSGTLTSAASGQAGNCLQIANAGSASGDAYQDITTVAGRIYKLTLYFKKGTGTAGGSVEVGTTGAPTAIINGAAMTDAAWTQYSHVFLATGTTTRITLRNESATSAETALFDTVVCEEIYDGFIEIMKNCKCKVYAGTQAASADTGASDTNLIVTVANAGNGMTFEPSSNGVVAKATAETWSGTISLAGTNTATWARFYVDGDDTTATSTTAPRFDCTINTSNADIIVGSASCTNGLTFQINSFSYTAPKS
jgi:hypothetical protein